MSNLPRIINGGDAMSEQKIEFKWLEAKCIGTDTIVFRLEDKTTVKIKVDIDRAGVSTSFTNPDGTPRYNIGASLKVNVIPAKKSYYLPKSQLRGSPLNKSQNPPFIR